MRVPVRLVLFDVNETLTDMSALRVRFEQVGAPAHLLPLWFAGVLRDGFALTAAGAYGAFRQVADSGLRALLAASEEWRGDTAQAVSQILDGFAELPLHPDIEPGVRALSAAGMRLATFTNGDAAATDAVVRRAGLRDCFEALLDVGAPRAWKPAPLAYHYAARHLGAEPAETLLVAVHPWDLDGARRAGLQAAWLRRGADAGDYPAVMTEPTYGAADLVELAGVLTGQAPG
ncbi:haloacid dehalogenase type II [Actinocrinis puniceicyclus]|uniref:Haloacid dehalogenase type II n=1 Tax=Actinocrinis puniceicyclus TaxID=977794 RepID=A0A8J8BF40_9ACTN|nr:haloacid dehalogenase type II [Actinocrinis puniceicyclus]MBS2964374.1 haloacid dehalogenase type II [Actinocrinis puniceicyclus]